MSAVAASDPGLTASYPNVIQKLWSMTGADTGNGVAMGEWKEKTITAYGTWDSATLIVQGADVDTDAAYMDLKDKQGLAVALTADGASTIDSSPLFIRVKTSGGGASTAVAAYITGRKDR